MKVVCSECGMREMLSPERWRCDCGGAWEPVEQAGFDLGCIDRTDASLWRYRRLYDLDFDTPSVRMGAGWTPLLAVAFGGREVLFKLEYMAPTGSFKDRGVSAIINILDHQGVTGVVEDSSGNAGASVAAYAARAGMKAQVFVPAYASPAKLAQIAIYGADVFPVSGPRENATQAAWAAAARGAALASHAYHPGFLVGQESEAWELWEQLGSRAPDWYVVPVGMGGHLLGIWLGFRRLRAAGLIDRLPRLVAVQAEVLAPVCRAFDAGLATVPGVEPTGRSVAEGLAIARPVRGRRLLQALRESNGICVTVQDDATMAAQRQLARCGLYVEPSSATAVAALDTVFRFMSPGEIVVVSLTGGGLKGKAQ